MIDFTQMQAFSEDPLILTEGDGIRVRDVDGRWYIDGLSGTFCMSLGHGNARVVEAASKQLALALAAPTMATSDRSLELARELLALLPPQHHAQVGAAARRRSRRRSRWRASSTGKPAIRASTRCSRTTAAITA